MDSRQICAGCGWVAPADAEIRYRCPQAVGDDIDHVLQRKLNPSSLGGVSAAKELFGGHEQNPFLKFRRLLHSYNTGRANGMPDSSYEALVTNLGEDLRRVDGREFRATPLISEDRLAKAIGLTSRNSLWIKNETGNVAGSHKVRHLLGIMIWLKIKEALSGDETSESESEVQTLAISSCGNAALAAATVAAAAGRRLEVFIPDWAEDSVVRRLKQLEANLTVCSRSSENSGDPCYEAFRQAVADGATPFTCQGPDNGLNIEGGETLAWEMIADLVREGCSLDHLVVQVGGGALVSSCIQGFWEAKELGVIDRMPQIHTVQTQGAAPLERAYMKVLSRILNQWRKISSTDCGLPATTARLAGFVCEEVSAEVVNAALEYAAGHRSEFMWPWGQEPKSVASGILDDETYDWHVAVRGMLETGGIPVVVSEATLLHANSLAQSHTRIPVDPTGSAGLAGLLQLRSDGVVKPSHSAAVLFTGIDRSIGAF